MVKIIDVSVDVATFLCSIEVTEKIVLEGLYRKYNSYKLWLARTVARIVLEWSSIQARP
jgi:hypothetical protein